jgi:hypothetical protein
LRCQPEHWLSENFFDGNQGSISNNEDEVPETDPASDLEEVSSSGEGSPEEDVDEEVIPDDDDDEDFIPEDESVSDDELYSDERSDSGKLALDFLTDEEDGMDYDDRKNQESIGQCVYGGALFLPTLTR